MSAFIKGKSYWFTLDPRARVLFLIGVFLAAFAFDDPVLLFFGNVLMFIFLMRNEIPFKRLISILKPLSFTMVIYALITILWINPTPAQYKLEPFIYLVPQTNMFPIDAGSLLYLAGIILRVYIMTLAAWFVTMTLTPPELVSALTRWRLPPSFAVAGASSFASLPYFQALIQTIKEALQSKGWETEQKGLIGTLKSFVPILFPVFFMTLKRSQGLALAMECRGISQIEKRKPRKQLKYNGRDWVFTVFIMGLGIGCLVLFYGYGIGSVDITINMLKSMNIIH
jgi:energy-coupling factor transport system permease protein